MIKSFNLIFKNWINNELFKLILDMRVRRNAKFLFMPLSLKFLEYCYIIYLEQRNFKKADEFIIDKLITELIDHKILNKNPVDFYEYSFENLVCYDVHMKTSDNKVFYRGTSFDDKSFAYAKAFGELFERTSMKYLYQQKDLNVEKYSIKEIKILQENKKGGALYCSPLSFAQPTINQKEKYKYMNMTESDIFNFVKVKNITDDTDTYIPAQTIFFGSSDSFKEKDIIQQTTHGHGAGYTKEDAIKSGFFEVVHRHFFLKSWYEEKPVAKIKIESVFLNKNVTEYTKNLLTNFTERGFKIHVLNYTEESKIPTTICLLERFDGFYCGGSTDLSLEVSMQKSLSEAFSIYISTCQINMRGGNNINKWQIDLLEDGFVDDRMSASGRILFFANSYFTKNTMKDFFLRGDEKDFKEIDLSKDGGIKRDNSLWFIKHFKESVSEAIKNNFKDIFYFESNNPILEKYNYRVVKIVIPQTYFFALDEKYSRPVLNNNMPPKNLQINPFP